MDILGAAVALGAADIPVDPPSQLLIADGCLDANRADDDMVGLISDAIKLRLSVVSDRDTPCPYTRPAL